MEFLSIINNWWYLALSLAGLIVIISAVLSRRQADASQSWPATQGRVIESRLEKHESTDGEGHESISYSAVIRFTYPVMEQEYTGDRVAFGARPGSRSAVSEIVARYPQDSQVMVYYNPDKPGQAVLERASGSGMLQILVGIALLAAGIYLAIK